MQVIEPQTLLEPASQLSLCLPYTAKNNATTHVAPIRHPGISRKSSIGCSGYYLGIASLEV